MTKIRIVLADDHPILREGIRRVLEREVDFEVVGEASDGEEALALCRELRPDIVIIDIGMPRLNGLEATRRIKAEHTSTVVLVLTIHDDDQYILGLLEAGAAGYLLKSATGQDLIDTLHLVHRGESVLDRSVIERLLRQVAVSRGKLSLPRSNYRLTKREMQVLSLTVKGLGNKEIAQKLGVSLRTVKAYLGNVFNKMGVGSRTEAVYKAVSQGVVSLENPKEAEPARELSC